MAKKVEGGVTRPTNLSHSRPKSDLEGMNEGKKNERKKEGGNVRFGQPGQPGKGPGTKKNLGQNIG